MSFFKNLNISCLKAQYTFHAQVVFGTAFAFLTGGVFLSGFAMYLGAGDLLVSYISMITNICGVSIIFFSSFIKKFQSLKKAALTLTVISRLSTLLVVLIPLFIPKSLQIIFFVICILVAFTLQAQTTVVLNNWLVTFIKPNQSGKYIAARQTFALAITVFFSLAGGRILDSVSGAYLGFAILFLIAGVMSLIEIITLCRIPDASPQVKECIKVKLSDTLKAPIKCRPFFTFVIYIFLFYVMLSIADSFTVVYMMRYLGLSYTTTTVMQMLISLPQIFLLGIWGKISDKKGHKFVLSTSIWFFVFEMGFLAISNQQNLYICIPLAFIFAAVANSGFVISVFNRRYQLMPTDGRIIYDNFYTACVGLAVIVGPIIGGAIKQWLEASALFESSRQLGYIRPLYVVSTVLLVVLQLIFMIIQHKNKA